MWVVRRVGAFSKKNSEAFARFEEREQLTGRLGAPEEVADEVAFLVSQRACWVNGAMIPIGGAQGRPEAFWPLSDKSEGHALPVSHSLSLKQRQRPIDIDFSAGDITGLG
jgi:hypothetical protein